MRSRKIMFTVSVCTLIVLILMKIGFFKLETGFGYPFKVIIIILFMSIEVLLFQQDIDKNHDAGKLNYDNVDILKYVCSILILMLHLRPFIVYSGGLDFFFNNIITRLCAPAFFLITGYFVAKNERKDPGYIKKYIKKTIPMYLVWSILYIPAMIGTAINNVPLVNDYLAKLNIPSEAIVPLVVILVPLALVLALLYTGFYYHLWYFPAVIISLFILSKWKNKFKLKYLLIISFILLLFGATETYYGVLPFSVQEVLSYYYQIFFTTRNFLFFGLFYVVLGYRLGTKKDPYIEYSFLKLTVWIFLLIFEATILQNTARLNSNILLSCIPLVYYLFISVIYQTNIFKTKFPFRELSKYYYLVHPMVIFVAKTFFSGIKEYPFYYVLSVIVITHLVSLFLIKLKKKYRNLVI